MIVAFTLGDMRFGFRAVDINEIVKTPAITPVPLAPHTVMGLATLRGQVVTIHDLTRCLDLPHNAKRMETMTIIATHAGEMHGFLVDAVQGIISSDELTLHDLPGHATWHAISEGALHDGAQLVTLLNIKSLIERTAA